MEYSLIAPRCYDNLVTQVLINRGLRQQDIPHYINTTKDDLLNPSLIKNVDVGAKMLIKHINNKDKIFI